MVKLPPQADELEISIFGPGFGECLAVHYGAGQWLTVDSCLEVDGTPSALRYFGEIGVDPSTAVTHVVITHPDADHLGGIANLFAACASARLVCSAALTRKEMTTYVAIHARADPSPLATTPREIYDLLQLSIKRKNMIFAKQDLAIVSSGTLAIDALAPSDRKIEQFIKKVAKMLPKPRDARRAAPGLLPNAASVALLITRDNFSAILGADLEETPGLGWSTIISDSVRYKVAPSVSVFKVAHHGSVNADCPNLWGAMNRPIAILSPFSKGAKKLPAPSDVDRILKYTKEAHSTATFKSRPIKRLSRVDNILWSHGIKKRDLYPANGHVRLRIALSGDITIERFNNAVHLSGVH